MIQREIGELYLWQLKQDMQQRINIMKYKHLVKRYLLHRQEDVGELQKQLLKNIEKKDEFILAEIIIHNQI